MDKKYDKYGISEMTVMIEDYGGFTYLVEVFARYFKRVLYYSPYESEFARSQPFIVGTGIPNVERIDNVDDYESQTDLFFFTDLHKGARQERLRDAGKAVFGSGKIQDLELYRTKLKELLKDLDLPVNKYEVANGFSDLKEKLKGKKDVWVKSDFFRGDGETFRYEDDECGIDALMDLERDLGINKEQENFIIEEPIKDAIEYGYDGFVTTQGFPDKTLFGIEVKDCYDDKTEVLTDRGWILFKDLDKTEKVFTLCLNDGKGYIKSEYQIPTDYIERHYKGQLINIEKDSVSLNITPTHNILVMDGVQNEFAETVSWKKFGKDRVYEKEATEFKRGKQLLRLQKAIDVVNRNKVFSLFQPKPILVSNLVTRNNYIQIGDKKITKKIFAAFMGAYLSEGCSIKRYYKSGKGYSYSINISQFKYVEQFKDILDKMPYKFTRVKSGFNCYDFKLGEYLHQFGYAREKYIPDFIKQSNKSVINAFLDAYCLGDGTFTFKFKSIRKDSCAYNENYTHKVMQGRKFYTASKRMADDLQELLVLIGSVAVSGIDKFYYNKTKKMELPMYGVQEKLINRKNYIFPKDVSYIDYSGNVYCVTVPNGIIMIRRNGKSMWCGNCSYAAIFTDYDKLPKTTREANEKLLPVFMSKNYNGWYSSEERCTKKDFSYYLDMTARLGEPPTSLACEMFKDYPIYCWEVANGIVPKVEAKAKYGVQLIIKSDRAVDHPQRIFFPEKYKVFVKIKSLHIDENGHSIFVPQNTSMTEIGAVIFYADTLKAAKEGCIKIAKEVRGYGLKINLSALDDAESVVSNLIKYGVNLF